MIGVSIGIFLGLAGVIFCYCTQALCFQGMGGDDIIIEEYGGSKDIESGVVSFHFGIG
jgi:hypothetical protein